MPIEPKTALNQKLSPGGVWKWGPSDVALYHLALGAGVPPTDPRELRYTTESDLVVLPTFGVLPAFEVAERITEFPGLAFDLAKMLHGEHELVVDNPIPQRGEVTSIGEIEAVVDKGKAALVVLAVKTALTDGTPLVTNRFTLFIREEGGFGGPATTPSVSPKVPERTPDAVVESATLPQQALLYRLCGDRNPLHADPGLARSAGFDRPILHGLCTFGIAVKAAVDSLLNGEPSRVRRCRVRFKAIVYPGETLRTSLWSDGGAVRLQTTAAERDEIVLGNAVVELNADGQ